ncbi:MAG: STAS domain-containing protein [Planctomycetota bacterium]|jgi:anti-sigma B factor antagonist
MDGLEINENVLDSGIAVLTLVGALSEDTIDDLETAIRKQLDAGIMQFVIDCEKLSYLNSKGVGAFNWAVGGVRARKGDIKFCNVKGKAKSVFDMLGIGEFIQIYPSAESAADAFKDPSGKPEGAESVSFVAGKDGKYYHFSWCEDAKDIAEEGKIEVSSRIELFGTEKMPCPNCRPDLA